MRNRGVEVFDEKYDDLDIHRLASELPKLTRLTISGVHSVYPTLSKNHIYAVIHERNRINAGKPSILENLALTILEPGKK